MHINGTTGFVIQINFRNQSFQLTFHKYTQRLHALANVVGGTPFKISLTKVKLTALFLNLPRSKNLSSNIRNLCRYHASVKAVVQVSKQDITIQSLNIGVHEH